METVIRNRQGFTLLAMIGILAIITIGAAILLPNMVTVIDQQVTKSESENLKLIGQGTQAYLQANRAWPLTLAVHSPNYAPFDSAQLLKNARGYLRYFALHPSMLLYVNPLGLAPSSLPDARFLLISDLSTNANPLVLLPGQFETWWATAETKDRRIYKGNLAPMFPELNLSGAGPGGSYQIDGVPISTLGLTTVNHLRHHVRGTAVSLDEANVYSNPELEFQLMTNVAYVFVPCLPVGRRWVVPPVPNCSALWISTSGDASGNPGYSSWGPSEVVSFGEPNLAYEYGPTGQTSGEFGAVLDLEDFISGEAVVDAAHYVNRQIVVGTTIPMILNKGDILLSTADAETLTSLNSLSVQDEDVVVFRPLNFGDYSSGTFFMLIDGSDIGLPEVNALSLVEWDTLVGDQIVKAGSFLISTPGNTDVHLFVPTRVGRVTSGSLTLFIDGSDITINREWDGIHLIGLPTMLGDATLQPGEILGTLRAFDAEVGDNSLNNVYPHDIFLLDLSRVGSATEGDASFFFDGSDVGLTGDGERVDLVTAYGGATGLWEQANPLVVVNPRMELSLLGILTGWSLTGDLSGNGADNHWGAVTSANTMGSARSGTYFASGRATGADGSGEHLTGIYQRIDVTLYSASINAGDASLTVYAYAYGENGQDYSFIRVSFYDAIIGGNKIGDSVESTPATESFVWKPLMINFQAIPAGTKSIELMLLGQKVSAGSYNDTGFDDVTVTLNIP